MKEYDVKITETLEKTVTVQAESHDAAEEQVRAAYYNSEYILDSENFTGVAFGTTEEREVQKEQADTMNVLLVKPFMYPQAVQIGCELEDLQKAVGGDIEATYPFNEPVALVMHDEGKLVGKELNRALRDDDGDIYDITGRRIESAADLCHECLDDVAMDVLYMTGNDHAIEEADPLELAEIKRRWKTYIDQLPEYAYLCDELLSGRK